MTAGERWSGRALTAEALALLIVAQYLVAYVRFARWRRWLGEPCPPAVTEVEQPGAIPPCAHRAARAVDRAALRLPGDSKCLPRAMALLWMLRRRRLSGQLRLGVLAGCRRGGIDDLHAWVTFRGTTLIGHSDLPHREILTLER